MSDGPSQGEEMSRGLPTGGTPGCAGGSAPDRTNIYMTPAQLATVRALRIATGGERIYMDLAQVQELLAADAERDRLLDANLRACEILLWASLPCSVKKEPVSYLAVMSAAGLLASARLSTHPLPVTAAEIPGARLGWKRALDKIHDLVGEFGTTPAECLGIIGEYIGESLHAISQGKTPEPVPIDMVLHCPDPKCGVQHVDAPEPGTDWTNPPHRSHKCHGCGTVWRPADLPTNGVAAVQTRGKADTWPGAPAVPTPSQEGPPDPWVLLREARANIDRDRTGLAGGLNAIQNIVKGYNWIPAGEWGSYSWEEQTETAFRAEVGNAFEAISTEATRVLSASGKLANEACRRIDDALRAASVRPPARPSPALPREAPEPPAERMTVEELAAIHRFIEDQREHPNGMGCGNMATQHIPPPSPVPAPSGSAEERLAALEKHHHETSLAAAHDLAEALRERAAAYARGLERALEVFRSLMPLGEAGIEWAYWDRIEKSFAKEIGRALAGTGAQPPSGAAVELARDYAKRRSPVAVAYVEEAIAAAEARRDAAWRTALSLSHYDSIDGPHTYCAECAPLRVLMVGGLSSFAAVSAAPAFWKAVRAVNAARSGVPAPVSDDPARLPAIITFREDDAGTISINVPGFTTIRACRHCGVLIAGGPSACVFCASRSLKWRKGPAGWDAECACGTELHGFPDSGLAEQQAKHMTDRCGPVATPEKSSPTPAAALRSRVVIGEAADGWHVALATYPASMDTACGKKMLPATQFETTDAARGHTFCIACLHAWPEPGAET